MLQDCLVNLSFLFFNTGGFNLKKNTGKNTSPENILIWDLSGC